MTPEQFTERFQQAFQGIYFAAARRIRDGRQRLSPETIALLLHLAGAGPMSLSEMARHVSRAPSTLSTKVDLMVSQGLLERQPDLHDGRRHAVWLSDLGRRVLTRELDVLDRDRIAEAAAGMSAATRQHLMDALDEFHRLLSGGKHHEP